MWVISLLFLYFFPSEKYFLIGCFKNSILKSCGERGYRIHWALLFAAHEPGLSNTDVVTEMLCTERSLSHLI